MEKNPYFTTSNVNFITSLQRETESLLNDLDGTFVHVCRPLVYHLRKELIKIEELIPKLSENVANDSPTKRLTKRNRPEKRSDVFSKSLECGVRP